MKRLFALLLALAMVFSLAACGNGGNNDDGEGTGGQQQGTPSGGDAQQTGGEDMTWGLKPFDQRQTLTLGFFTGSPLSYPFLFADKLGVFDALNIDVEYECFTGGPAMVEASAEYDIGSLGLGGICIALLNGMRVIDITDYEENMAIFVRPDSDLAKDPANAEKWKGVTCVYPAGTTAQAILANYLNTMGLTLADVESVNMDNANGLTGFSGGTGDVLVCWNAIALSAEDAGFIRVTDAGQLGMTLPCATIVTEETLAEKEELITVACAVFHKAVEWCYASDENLAQAAAWYLEHCDEEGFLCTEEVAQRTMEWYRGPTVEEWIDLYTATSADDAGIYTGRDLYQAEKDILVGLDFFISEGKYQPEDRTSYLDKGLIDPIIAQRAAEMLG